MQPAHNEEMKTAMMRCRSCFLSVHAECDENDGVLMVHRTKPHARSLTKRCVIVSAFVPCRRADAADVCLPQDVSRHRVSFFPGTLLADTTSDHARPNPSCG